MVENYIHRVYDDLDVICAHRFICEDSDVDEDTWSKHFSMLTYIDYELNEEVLANWAAYVNKAAELGIPYWTGEWVLPTGDRLSSVA